MRTGKQKDRGSGGIRSWLGHLLALSGAAFAYAVGKWHAMKESQSMLDTAEPLVLSPSSAAKLMEAWGKLPPLQSGSVHLPSWSPDELALIGRIQSETKALNRNNVTRTEAYRNLYFRSPELHWALIAHMVSRNGGWNMTDLQGEWLTRLLNDRQRKDVFMFLERGNSLIFGDAYPQMLLYEWSRRLGRSFFHLLPAFGVSAFMEPVWRQFWKDGDSVMLSTALIVNEQHYIDRRVARNPYYEERVLHTMFFGLQSLLQMNAVFFPYRCEMEDQGEDLQLAGLILEQFQQLGERIEFGKRLYAMLFGIPRVLDGVRHFAAAVKHTGSRADYAPGLFQPIRHQPPERIYAEKLLGGKLKPGAAPLYSPPLHAAWGDHEVEPPEPGDWFEGPAQVGAYFRRLPFPQNFEMTNEYGLLLNKLELAVLAAQRGMSPLA
ncbi:DUF2515 domain-containing protein [Paenibacillus sp. LHD-117]|uniref:DUF2515 domain-containing protein n=1 Tax=Paenibacillus sp. LHD-117 TaxID=3071412 RepID=UPI0027DF0647|nr:DUF2515 domain-containing protein [Paenibacillus sp. LHD-117]MDQ6420813.1 DUF2515 domain-containing protein [Paenibacillus sp. LHD-117]